MTAVPAGQDPVRSPFAGADIISSAGWTALPGSARPCFEQDLWDLRGVRGVPQHLAAGDLTWDFTAVINPRWRLIVKEILFACLVPSHPQVAVLAYAHRAPLAPATCARRLQAITAWLNWLASQGVSSLGQVTQHHCDSYLALRSQVRSQLGQPVRDASISHKRSVLAGIIDLAIYRELLTSDRYAPGLQPWHGARAAAVAGHKRPGENKTQPVPDAVLQPLLAACLFVVEALGPHVADLLGQIRAAARRDARQAAARPRPGFADMARVLEQHRLAGEPLTEMVPHMVRRRLAAGWSPSDPLLRVSFQPLAERAGCREFRTGLLSARLRELTEETLAAVGLAKPWARRAAAVPRADNQQPVPWSEPLHTLEVLTLAEVARNACLTVAAALSGMRNSELAELLPGCRRITRTAPGLTRYRLAGKLIKGQPLGGLDEEWVVIEQVHQAIALAERLASGDSAPLFGRISFHSRYARSLQPWVNGPAGRRLGLAPIPDGLVNLRMLRRTLAMELAYRPGGLLAAKVHLRHLSAVTTEGYAKPRELHQAGEKPQVARSARCLAGLSGVYIKAI